MAVSTGAHKVILKFDDGLYAELICPESGCVPAENCFLCGRSVHETCPDIPPCYDCKDGLGIGADECWLRGWFDNLTAEELLSGNVEVAITAEWDCDHPVVTIQSGAPVGETGL